MDLHLQQVVASLGLRLDANETAVLAKQLEFVKAQTYDIKRPSLKARQFIPVDNSLDPGTETIVYRQWDEYGAAKIIANYADDLPLVDVSVKEFTGKVISLGQAYQWSIQDLRRAAMSGAQLDTRRANAARNAIERSIDEIGAFGDAAAGLPGFLNNANVPISPAGLAWAGATPTQILADMNGLAQSIVTATKEVHQPDTMLFDSDSFGIISTRRVDPTDSKTILQTFLQNSPYIRNVDQWIRLNLADLAGTGPRVVAYQRDPEVLQFNIPQEFEQFPPQARNLSFVVPCHARVGGVEMHYPLAVAYLDGV